MAATREDPTQAIRLRASRYAGVDEGTACTQSSFKVGKKAFLFIGMQGGRYKAMFKLAKSIPEASKLAQRQPDRFGVGSTGWVTARFTAEEPMPASLWRKWLDESYALSEGGGGRGTSSRKAAKKGATRKKSSKTTTKKKATRKTSKKTARKTAKKNVARKATTKTAAKKRAARKTTRR